MQNYLYNKELGISQQTLNKNRSFVFSQKMIYFAISLEDFSEGLMDFCLLKHQQ